MLARNAARLDPESWFWTTSVRAPSLAGTVNSWPAQQQRCDPNRDEGHYEERSRIGQSVAHPLDPIEGTLHRGSACLRRIF